MVLCMKELHPMGLYLPGRGSKPPAGQTHQGQPARARETQLHVTGDSEPC